MTKVRPPRIVKNVAVVKKKDNGERFGYGTLNLICINVESNDNERNYAPICNLVNMNGSFSLHPPVPVRRTRRFDSKSISPV